MGPDVAGSGLGPAVAALARQVPVWVWLTAIVACSGLFRAVIGRGVAAPFIFVDELIWAELARGIAEAGEPLVRGEPESGYSLVYPLVLSPLYALFDTLPAAYEAVKALNAFVMSLAAVPAYALARRVVGPGFALLGALLAVAIPSFAYTGTVMTENAFYPLFLALVLLLVLVLERPTGLRVAALVVVLAVSYATRVQAAALFPAILLAPLVLAIFERRGLRATVAHFRLLYGTFAALAGLVLVAQLVGGRSPRELLGAYSPIGDATYEPGEVLRYLVWHAAELGLYVLVIPVAATIVLVARARALDRPLQAFLAALLSLAACLLPSVAAFASVFSQRIQERNLFYLAPLFAIALLAWVERGAPRPRLVATAAAAASALLVLLIPFDRFITTSAITDTLMLLPFWSLQDRIGASWIAPAALGLGVALAAAFLLVPARFALVLPLLVLCLWAAALKPVWWGKHGFEQAARGSLFQGIREARRDWIDRALPPGAEAAFLWTGRTDRLTVNHSEFFNRGVGPVYYVVAPTPGHLPETRVEIDAESGEVTHADGRPVTDRYVVADSSFEPAGTPLGRDRGWGVVLWRVTPPLVSATRVDGLYPNDSWSGPTVTYLRRRCTGGRLLVSLSGDPSLFFEPVTVVARARGTELARVTFEPDEHTVLTVPLTPIRGTDECRVAFTVTPTAVPAEVTAGENPDPRVLGAHFDRFTYVGRS
ncbi:MAG TPA: glycosyltransferase family 39 protein [Gaiellaceae bacterium]|nr:glycosyltransferase family 39 protein [Gaiellaceae bacterium]